jgi:serpin B
MKTVVMSGAFLVLATVGTAAGWALAASETGQTGGAQEEAAAANNRFAFDFYREIGKGSNNAFFSPFSLTSALGMTAQGAKGTTAAQMAAALGWKGSDLDRLYDGLGQLSRLLDRSQTGQGPELAVANALWGRRGLDLRSDFLERSRQRFGAGLDEVDFAQPEAARQRINRWVEDATRNRIRDLIPPGMIRPNSGLILTNAVYFKGKWSIPFPKEASRNGTFHTNSKSSVETPLMHRTARFGYAEDEHFQLLEMGYEDSDLSMVVLLPRAVDGLDQVRKPSSPAPVDRLLKDIAHRLVDVTLPRYELTCAVDATALLKRIGMTLAFDDAADFSGITVTEPLKISFVMHKAFVDVNEEGTEAAASTGVGMVLTAAPVPSQPVVFRADHPFLFLIRHRPTGAILFMGQVANPTMKS